MVEERRAEPRIGGAGSVILREGKENWSFQRRVGEGNVIRN